MAEQSVAELIKKVRRVQIVANRAVNDLLAGQYKSVFRGRGMEFDEVREYQPGDDIRAIDWNVTARAGDAYIKQFCEERELTILFAVDVSASGVFGSGERSKLELVVELAALLMFSALKNNDKVGLVLFCNDVERYFPPRKGKGNVLRLIRELLATEPLAQPTRLQPALEFINRVQKRRAVVFLISDFIAENPTQTLAMTNRRHDLVAITVTDPREHELPSAGLVTLRDAETGQIIEIDTRSPRVREIFQRRATERDAARTDALRKSGIDELVINTREPYTTTLRKFFHARERRYSSTS